MKRNTSRRQLLMPADKTHRIVLVAGEASGSQHGAALAQALHRQDDNFQLSGMGMKTMQEAGVQLIEDADDTAVTGIVEVLRYYPRIRKKFNHLCQYLQDSRPDLLILIDYPDFNLKLAKFAHRRGIKTLFYISPQVWAWRAGRVRKIARSIDVMVVVFPFELAYYEKTNMEVHCVAHPLIDEARAAGVVPGEHRTIRSIPVSDSRNILLLPGSRDSEIKQLLPILCQTAKLLSAQAPNLRFSLLLAPGIKHAQIKHILKTHQLQCDCVTDNYTAMQTADFAIVTSGTATLQLTLCATPMVVIYKTSWLTYLLLKLLIRAPYIALPNILARKLIVKELIQRDANPVAICKTVLATLNNENNLAAIRTALSATAMQLGTSSSSKQLAQIVRRTIDK